MQRTWTPAQSANAPTDQRAVAPGLPALRFTVARYSNNELVLFDTAAQESWIVYPPRSNYTFLRTRRATTRTTVVEHHPWAPYSEIVMHEVDATEGCREHGLGCGASSAIQAGVRAGWDPFS